MCCSLLVGMCVIGKFCPLPSGHSPVMATLQLDRGCIIDTSCTCGSTHLWCPHTTALVVKEMSERSKSSPASTPLTCRTHPPLSESLSELSALQLRKVMQYLVSECGDPSVLLTVQRLLDQLRDETSDISQLSGAPGEQQIEYSALSHTLLANYLEMDHVTLAFSLVLPCRPHCWRGCWGRSSVGPQCRHSLQRCSQFSSRHRRGLPRGRLLVPAEYG